MIKDAIYPMRAVVHQTGLTAHVIRAWERRYGAVNPHRTSSQRRLYTMADIERLKLLKRGIKAGNSIAQIAKMNTDALRELIPSAMRSLNPPPIVTEENGVSAQAYVDEAMEAIVQLEPSTLAGTLDRASVGLPRVVLMNNVVLPLLENIGTMWSDGRLKIVNEHMASMVLRQFLGEVMRAIGSEQGGPMIVAATPSGQWHEFGAMIAAIIAIDAGWQGFYCGPNLPAEEIAAAAIGKQAGAVALSVVQPTDVHQLAKEIRRLERLLPQRCRLFVGGGFAQSLAGQFGSSPWPTFVYEMSAFKKSLQEMMVQ